MKKLNFKLAGIVEPLTKEQMKEIKGGTTDPTCVVNCYDASYDLAGSIPVGGGCQSDSQEMITCIINGHDVSYADCYCF